MTERSPTTADGRSRTTLKTLERGLQVFEAVSGSGGRATAKSVSRQVDLKLGTCYHLLRTMVASGHLVRTRDGRYDVGPRSAYIGERPRRDTEPTPELLAALIHLHWRTRETCALVGWDEATVFVHRWLPAHGRRSPTELGAERVSAIHAHAPGRAILAHLPAQEQERLVRGPARDAEPSIVDPAALACELADIRARGFAIDDGGPSAPTSCISAPVLGATGRPVGAYTVAVSILRAREGRLHLIREVKHAAAIAHRLIRSAWHLRGPCAEHTERTE